MQQHQELLNKNYLKKQNPPLKKIKDGKKIAMKKKNYH